MGSTLICKVRICQKPLNRFFHQRSSALSTLNTPVHKSSQLPPSARLLCTRDTSHNPAGRQTDRRSSVVKHGSFSQRGEKLWDKAVNGRGKSSTPQKKPFFPKSVFAAGTAKRMAEKMKRTAGLVSRDEDRPEGRTTHAMKMQPPDRPLSAAEWRNLRESLNTENVKRFDIRMMNALFTSRAELDVAKSLLTFVAMETGTLSYELLLMYLTLCVSGGHDAEVSDVYDIMRGSFPSLETGASSLFIRSFSRTERWRQAVSLLHEMKVFTPSSRNYGDVISAAMQHGDMTTAWALYDELTEKGLIPRQETWDALFKGVRQTEEEKGKDVVATSQSEHQERLLGLLLHMRNNQIYPQHSLASSIKTWFESLPGQKWKGSWTTPTPKGTCSCCGAELESIQLTAEEYQLLKDRVITDVIEGQDVFTKTTPEELKKFIVFVKRKPAFDVVVDGLNVANITNDKRKQSETLLAVVSELECRGQKILVLGRKHMLHPSIAWQRRHMDLIQQKAQLFVTDNISEDDPFLLYATLHSGSHCQFVSRDLMRDHKACMPDGLTRQLFFKWQRGHQLVVCGDVRLGKRVQFQGIPRYDTIIQTSVDSWHIPYDKDTEERSTYEVPQHWLCLTRKH